MDKLDLIVHQINTMRDEFKGYRETDASKFKSMQSDISDLKAWRWQGKGGIAVVVALAYGIIEIAKAAIK